MADNVELNAGTGGAVAATDDVVGVHYQRVKLVDGTLGGTDAIAGDATNGLDVDVTRIIPGTTATALGKAEDVAHASGDVGVLMLAVRRDTAAVGSDTDGDNSTLNVDASGRLHVNVGNTVTVGSHAVTNAGTFATQASQAGTWNITNVSGTVSLPTGAATAAKQPALGTAGSASADVISVQGIASMTALQVADNGGSLTVDNGGTFAVQSAGAAAHDAAVSGGPVLGGAYASAAAPTDVSADGDAVRLWALLNGSQVVNLAAGGALIGATSNALDVNIKSGAGSGGTAMADDAAFTAATTSFTPVGGIVTADSVDSGDGGAFAMLANRQQKVTLYDSAGVELAVGGGTQYTEDAAAAANPVGNALIVVRDDARGGTLTTADGDNVALRGTNAGELYVKHVDALTVNSHAVTNAGTFAVQAAQSGTWNVTVNAAIAAGNNNIGDVDIASIAAGDNNIGNVDVLTVPADPFGANADASSATGSISAKLRFMAAGIAGATSLPAGTNNIGDVDVLSLPALPAGTNNIGDVDVLTLPNVTLAAGTNTNEVVGDAAHDAAIAGNPVRIAGRAMTADYTSVASGDTADILCTLNGKQVVQPFAIPENTWSYAAASGGIVNTTGVTAKAAGAAGIRNYITHVDVVNGHATVSTDVQIRDGAAGTVLWRGFAQAAGGGVSATFDPPLRGTAATLVEVACGTTGTATYFNLTGYIGP